MTRDRWQVTRDTWHVTRDTFGGVNILSKFQLPSSYRLWFMILWRSGGKGWVTQLISWSMNYEAVYRTAPATPGLLNIIVKVTQHSKYIQHCIQPPSLFIHAFFLYSGFIVFFFAKLLRIVTTIPMIQEWQRGVEGKYFWRFCFMSDTHTICLRQIQHNRDTF